MNRTPNRAARRELARQWLTETDIRNFAVTAYELARRHFIHEYPRQDPDYNRQTLIGDIGVIFAALLAEQTKLPLPHWDAAPEDLHRYLELTHGDNAVKLSYVSRYTSSRIKRLHQEPGAL